MPIKNYTTKIDVYTSLGEIQGALASHGGESPHRGGAYQGRIGDYEAARAYKS